MNLFIDIYNSIQLISNLLFKSIFDIFIININPNLDDIEYKEDILNLKLNLDDIEYKEDILNLNFDLYDIEFTKNINNLNFN
jgi:hypothetical protein